MAVAVRAAPFEVHLDVYAGPFDLLLGLISKHKLDITEVALAQVTDEFVAHLRAADGFDLDQTTAFLVVAATLLDLKAARLLPSAPVEDAEDLALLEARDLLFARLLQYRAYKAAASWLAEHIRAEARWTARDVSLPPELASVLPRVLLGVDAQRLAELAALALAPRPPELVAVDHAHAPLVDVAEHAAILTRRLSRVGTATFRDLCSDCVEVIEVVARFLAVLDLLREGIISVDQIEPLGELLVHLRHDSEAAGEPAGNVDGPGGGSGNGSGPLASPLRLATAAGGS